MTKTIVIFANSVKHQQHCVAGKDIETKQWIRPVGDRNGCELTHEQVLYTNSYGTYTAKPLQKMDIEFSNKAPLRHQPENYIISGKTWAQCYGNINENEIVAYLDSPNDLWLNGVNQFPNNKVNYQKIASNSIQISNSLYLIKVNDITIDKSNRKATFNYNGVRYQLSITDPRLNFVPDGKNSYYLVISLGEEFNGYCYKLVAAILTF